MVIFLWPEAPHQSKLHAFHCIIQKHVSAAGIEEEDREGRKGKNKKTKQKECEKALKSANSFLRLVLSVVRVILSR